MKNTQKKFSPAALKGLQVYFLSGAHGVRTNHTDPVGILPETPVEPVRRYVPVQRSYAVCGALI